MHTFALEDDLMMVMVMMMVVEVVRGKSKVKAVVVTPEEN